MRENRLPGLSPMVDRRGAPGRIRTFDQELRRLLLCPLSYGGSAANRTGVSAERVKGVEPSPPAWKAGALPLSYTRAYEPHITWLGGGSNPLDRWTAPKSPPEGRPSFTLPCVRPGGGRAGRIRTDDLLLPKQARCQAAPQPVRGHSRKATRHGQFRSANGYARGRSANGPA